MQIVINIDNSIYKSIKNNGYIYEEEVEEIALSIIGGIPLNEIRTEILNNAERCNARASGLYMAVNIIDEYKNDEAKNEESENEYS